MPAAPLISSVSSRGAGLGAEDVGGESGPLKRIFNSRDLVRDGFERHTTVREPTRIESERRKRLACCASAVTGVVKVLRELPKPLAEQFVVNVGEAGGVL
jgi:hypothetical protein